MRLLVISLGLMTLATQIFCQESSAPAEVGEINEVSAADAVIGNSQSVQEPAQTEDKKLTKRSHVWGPWGWPGYGYGWPWPGLSHGGWGSHGSYGGHGGGWYGGWYGGHGWPWWYSGHGSGWHEKW